MRLVIVGGLFLWRVVSCCWLALLCWLADHALAVTCTDELGLGFGLGLEEMRWRRCGTCCSAVVCVQNSSFFLFSTVFQKGQTNKPPTTPFLIFIIARIT
jgi:hypothetical protein